MVEPDDEYELVPEQEIHELREEMEDLKHAYLSDGATESSTLIEAIDKLSSQIHRLIAIFEDAGKHINEDSVKDFKSEVQSLGKIADQNDKIAKGLLKVAGMVKELKKEDVPVSRGISSPVATQTNNANMGNMEMSNVFSQEMQHAFDTPAVTSSFSDAQFSNETSGQYPPPGAFAEPQSPPGTPSIPTENFDPFMTQPAFDNNPFSSMPSSSEPMPQSINLSGQRPPPQPPPDTESSLAPGGLAGNRFPSTSMNTDDAARPHESFEEFKARKLAEKNAKKY